MHAERVIDNMDLAVKQNLADRLTLFKIAVFDLNGVVVEVFVCFTVVGRGVFLEKKSRQFLCFYQGNNLGLDRFVVVFEVF